MQHNPEYRFRINVWILDKRAVVHTTRRYTSSLYISFTFLYTPVKLIRQLKCDGTCAETRFSLSAQRTSPFKSAGGRQFSRLLAAEVCAAGVVILDTPCSEVRWRVLPTHSIRQFPLHFPSRASPCAITFQLEPTSSPKRRGQLWGPPRLLLNGSRRVFT